MILPSPILITQTTHSQLTLINHPLSIPHLSIVYCTMVGTYISHVEISHVGLAIFNPTGFPTQWVLVLSSNELFQGRVVCSTVGVNVNGWQEIWTECDYSPASFNRAATFAGVVHIAELTKPMETVHAEIKSKGIVLNPAYTDRYVLQALRRIGDRRYGPSILSREKELNEAIQARIHILNQSPRTTTSFPIVSISLDGVRFGKSQWH